jgi:hypothetical protein
METELLSAVLGVFLQIAAQEPTLTYQLTISHKDCLEIVGV